MKNPIVQEAILSALQALEQQGDIVITTSTPSQVMNRIFDAVQAVSPNLLNAAEYSAIISAAANTCSGFRLDNWDFQTHIGMTREDLAAAIKKLQPPA